jgi:catechol 2,3-dioxygenase-like lactoylglutathione lyase family enzyme
MKEAPMLSDYPLNLAIATKDLETARAWYSEKLGFEPVDAGPWLLMYRELDSTFTVYLTSSAGTAKNTVAIWRVKDLRAEKARLESRGVRFEDYDFGDERTVDGIMTSDDGTMNAWFADGDGNIWGLVEPTGDDRPPGIGPTLAASDLGRATAWWRDKLGFEPEEAYEGELAIYSSGGKRFSIYQTPSAGTAKNTVAGWRVRDLSAEMAALRERGVVFEDYDFPEFKTEDGVFADPDGNKSAWIVDSEGNTVAINEDADSRAA